MTTTPADAQRDHDFRLLLLATSGAFSNYAVLLPLVPAWAAHGGAGPGGAGATTGVFMLTTVLTQLAVPALGRRYGYRAVLAAGVLALGAPTVGYLFTADLPALIGLSALRGTGFGLLTVAGAALVAELAAAGRRGRATGLYGLAVGLPNVVFLPVGIAVATQVNYPVVFAASTVLPVAALIAVFRMRRTGHAAGAPSVGARPRLGTLAGPWTVMLVVAVGSAAVTTFGPLAVPAASAAALAAFGVTNLVSRWGAGLAADRGISLLVSGTLVAAAGLGVLALAARPDAPAISAVLAGAAFGAGFGAAQNQTLVVLFDRVGAGRHGAASAAWNVAYDAGTGLGAVGLGLLAGQAGYPWAFAVVAVLVAGSLPVAWRARGAAAPPANPTPPGAAPHHSGLPVDPTGTGKPRS